MEQDIDNAFAELGLNPDATELEVRAAWRRLASRRHPDLVPWPHLCEVIQPHYPKGIGGRPSIGLARVLRVHFIQHWFNLSDMAISEGTPESVTWKDALPVGWRPLDPNDASPFRGRHRRQELVTLRE